MSKRQSQTLDVILYKIQIILFFLKVIVYIFHVHVYKHVHGIFILQVYLVIFKILRQKQPRRELIVGLPLLLLHVADVMNCTDKKIYLPKNNNYISSCEAYIICTSICQLSLM